MSGPKPDALPLGDGPMSAGRRTTGTFTVTHSARSFVNSAGPPQAKRASGRKNPQPLLLAAAEDGAAQAVVVHQFSLHLPHRFAAGQQFHRSCLG
jgi:hypothetical protein